jgi:hypothetical protein
VTIEPDAFSSMAQRDQRYNDLPDEITVEIPDEIENY